MPTQDISRFLHQPEKHYAGVRMQQGRVILDSDWNERSSIEAEDLRRTISELACSKGTPNDGMRISAATDDPYDFEIANGSYYLGGMRLAVDDADGHETFLTQSDWLQVENEGFGLAPAAVENTRIDLVYVMAWEQPVSAVEDSELFEVALGGRDTSVRIKRIRRFCTINVVDSNPPTFDVADGFASLISVYADSGADFDPATSELLSRGRLQVGVADGPTATEDPCNVPEVDGYVGAENRAIRVELRVGKLTWGFDNASPLYRVKGDPDAQDQLTFITLPADLPSMPRAGQVVEILRWGAKLPNGEKVAEPQGMMAKLLTTYDPITKLLVLDTEIPTAWFTWLDDHSVHYNDDDDDDEQKYFYLRVWDRGDDTTDAEIDYVLDTPLALGNTGLTVTVTQDGRPGDHWVIAARPATPDQFVPWDLDSPGGVAPHGPRRFLAPLALIRWTVDGEEVTSELEEGRTRLRTLCENGSCGITVGDGKESHGEVDNLQDAIDMLEGSGGKICLLPGVHEHVDNFRLQGTNDIVIEGCGPRSILTNPRPAEPSSDFTSFYTPVVTIVDSQRITLKNLRIEAYSAFGVLAHRTDGDNCERVTLDHVEFEALGTVVPDTILELPHSCLGAFGVTGLDVFDCQFETAAVSSLSYTVVLGSEHVRMHRCTVSAMKDGESYPAPGGINIRSTSLDVEIAGCRIEGGWGHGIALGHAIQHERTEDPVAVDPYGVNILPDTMQPLGQLQILDFDGCAPEPGGLGVTQDEDTELLWLPAGPVEDIRIYDNVIRGMGLSGISTSFFFSADSDWDNDTFADGVPRFIVAAEIDIARNLIEGNAQSLALPSESFSDFDVGLGGIVLAASVNAWIHENTIRNNGAMLFTPICGIGMVAAQNAVIEDNRILDNGPRHPGDDHAFLQRGLRGGIAIWEATTVRANEDGKPTFPATIANLTLPETTKDYTEASGESAVIVRGNEVSHPLGKALWVRRGFGPITVTGNSLEGFGDPVNGVATVGVSFCWNFDGKAIPLPASGVCVEIIDFGISLDRDWLGAEPFETPIWCDVGAGEFVGGSVLFASNTVSLDWSHTGGAAVACLLSSNDGVVALSNVIRVDMNSTFTPTETNEMDEFYSDILSEFGQHSFMFAGMYAGASGTVQTSMNRVIEGKFDALFSIVAGPAVAPAATDFYAVKSAVIVTSNVCSHLAIGVQPLALGITLVATQNVVVYPDEAPATTYTVEVLNGPDARVICVNGT